MKCHELFKGVFFPIEQLEEAFSRSRQVDEYKHSVPANKLLDLPKFKEIYDLDIMHADVTFIYYSEKALKQWNIGNYVYPHKDGAKELDPFHFSLVAPMKNYKNSMIRWFEGFDEEDDMETLRTGRFLKNFDDYAKCDLVDLYNFKTNQPVVFRVDVWHDVIIPFSGRLLMRWLGRQNHQWEDCLKTFKPYLES